MRSWLLLRGVACLRQIAKELRRMNDMHQEESRGYVPPKPRKVEFSVAREDFTVAEEDRL